MRWPRFRVRLWLLILLVAIAAGGMGGYALWRRADWFRWLSQSHARHAEGERLSVRDARDLLSEFQNDARALAGESDVDWRYHVTQIAGAKENVTVFSAWAEYHAEMSRIYDRAARRPWLIVPKEPDFPSPFEGYSRRQAGIAERERYDAGHSP